MESNPLPRSLRILRLARSRVGIYGRRRCQVCGQLGQFSGWAGAMAAHGGGSGPFVALAHQHSAAERDQVRGPGNRARFCEVCGAPSSSTQRGTPLCGDCAASAAIVADLGDLARVRFIEHTALDDAALERFEQGIHVMACQLAGPAPPPYSWR
jgi:hypothetical protein